ncbi:hypothetical protein O3P69_005134 [Scylla paramamosain]|uniref:Secreted protein n=1 Tax=Scylla paramamosain TaxID=85552 RepID=A0AAW0UDM6_SCYPA
MSYFTLLARSEVALAYAGSLVYTRERCAGPASKAEQRRDNQVIRQLLVLSSPLCLPTCGWLRSPSVVTLLLRLASFSTYSRWLRRGETPGHRRNLPVAALSATGTLSRTLKMHSERRHIVKQVTPDLNF